ncbi:DsbA family oxidoreductase [Veillonella seminalis]|uniref:DsbA family oxidoreductase n=1 Tax=Veillonella seminalis TaxID=1502943 RepID=UPI0023F422F6|nr:DsbA family oxidoreductase [Veillonella seminalis]
MEIIYWSDYACPFCFIGRKHLEAAIQKLNEENNENITVTMKAFELDPSAPTVVTQTATERLASKYGLTLEDAADRINGVNMMGQALGIDFRYDKAKPGNTFDAHRITKLAQAKDYKIAETLTELLYEAYFVKSEVISDHAVLIAKGKEAGLAEADVKVVLDSDMYAKEVREEEALAARYGINSVPFFVVNDKVALPGALPIEEFEKVLREMLVKEAE